MSENIVNYLVDYINFINGLKYDSTLYFRGENKNYPQRVPGIYRGNYYNDDLVGFQYPEFMKKGTKEYYFEMFRELGWTKTLFHENSFERITDLQHYKAITNILDVSTNPLVALFFACYEDETDDGKVYVYSSKSENERDYFGHTISIMTALNFISREVIDRFVVVFEKLMEIISEDKQYLFFNRKSTIGDIISNLESNFKTDSDIRKFGEELLPILDVIFEGDSAYINFRDNEKDLLDSGTYKMILLKVLKSIFEEFLEEINQNCNRREEIKYPFAIYQDILKSYIVRTAKINERIKNQQGAFIIPGYVHTFNKNVLDKSVVSEIQTEINKSLEKSIELIGQFKIPRDNKQGILKELKKFGIDESFIYPDIEYISKSISKKYKKE